MSSCAWARFVRIAPRLPSVQSIPIGPQRYALMKSIFAKLSPTSKMALHRTYLRSLQRRGLLAVRSEADDKKVPKVPANKLVHIKKRVPAKRMIRAKARAITKKTKKSRVKKAAAPASKPVAVVAPAKKPVAHRPQQPKLKPMTTTTKPQLVVAVATPPPPPARAPTTVSPKATAATSSMDPVMLAALAARNQLVRFAANKEKLDAVRAQRAAKLKRSAKRK